VAGPLGLIGAYHDTWRQAHRAHWFLIAGFLFAARILAFNVAFPLFAKERGFDSSQIGLLLAAVAISLFLFGIPITRFGSRGRSRQTLITGPLIAAAGMLLILVSPGSAMAPAIAGCLLAGMASNVFWVLGDPILAGVVPAEHRPRVFALKFTILTVGFAAGGLIGGWIPATLQRLGLSDLHAYAGALVVVLALDLAQSVCYWRMPATSAGPSRTTQVADAEHPRFSGLAFWGLLLLFIVPEMGMAMGYNAIRPYLSLFFDEEFGLAAGATGTVISLMQLAGGVGSLLIPSLALRIGPIRAMSLLRALGGAMIFIALGVHALPVVLLCFFVQYSIVDGTEATFINEAMHRMPHVQRPVFSAAAAAAWSLCSAIATSVSGFLQDETGGFGAAFGLGAAAYVASACWVLLVLPRIPNLFAGCAPAIAPRPAAAGAEGPEG
jgi:predicted MFS family arabinose efflux permease